MYSVNLGGVATQSLVSIGTNISSENASIQNASITSLSAVSFKTATFSPNTLNTSVLNVSSIILDPNFVFPVLNVSTLNSVEESFVNVSAVNISANQITADNIQTLLTAGDNISILNNTISALNNNLPATANFSELNTSIINASNLSTGDLTFGSNFTLSDKFLTVNSTTNITENSGDLITSGAVFNALNKFSVNISDGRSLTTTKLIEGGDVIKPIIPGTTSTVKTNVDAGTSQNIMKVFYTTKFGADAILSAVANFGYQVSGDNGDRITARLEYNNGSTTNNIGQQEQLWTNGGGGGTRSGVMSPRQGVRRSGVSAGTNVYFQIIIQNDSDDTFTFLTPDACNFHITESLDNAGSDLNLNTGDLQADSANFNSLTVQEGSGSGQATIGKTYLGNNAFSNMAALSVNGNDGATDYGFAQVSEGNTIMNAMPSSYNSFRSSNNEIASIGDIGLGIALGIGNTASFPLEVVGSALFSGVVFAGEFDSNEADITNISNTNFSGTNANFQEVNVSGNLIVNGTTFTSTNLTAGENINISNNVISAFFGSGGQVNLNYIQVDGGVDIGGVLNVSQTSNFSNSVNVGDILYVGEAGNHEGSVVIYSNIVGDNLTTKINSSTLEVNTSATGNLSVINFFVGNNKSLEITNSGIHSDTIESDAINVSTLDFIVAIGQEIDVNTLDVNVCINTSDLTAKQANMSSLILNPSSSENGLVVNGGADIYDLNVSDILSVVGSDIFLGSPLQNPNIFGGAPRSLINMWGVNASLPLEIGMRFGVNEDNTAGVTIEEDGGVDKYNIIFKGVDVLDIDNVSTTIHNKLNISQVDGLIGNFSTINASNLSTASISFDSAHFNFVNDELSLAVNASQIIANTISQVKDGITFNSSATLGGLFAVNSQTINATTLNVSNGNVSILNTQTVDALTIKATQFMETPDLASGQINASTISCNTLDADDLIVDNFNISTINFSNAVGDDLTTTQINSTTINTSSHQTDTLNISDSTTGQVTTIQRSQGNTNLTSNAGSVVFNTNPSSAFRALIIGPDNLLQTRSINNGVLIETENLSVNQNVSITGALSVNELNVSQINGGGLPTANMSFSDDFIFSSNVLSLSNDPDNFVARIINSSNINTSSITCADQSTFNGLIDATTIGCNQIDGDVGNFSTINASNLSTASISFDPSDFNFVNGELSLVATLPNDPNFSSVTASIGNFSNVNTSSLQTDTLNISDSTTGQLTTIQRSQGNTNLTSNAGSVVFNTNPSSAFRALIIGPDNLLQTRSINNGVLIETENLSVNQNVSITGALSVNELNVSQINASNLSTASISFDPSDFNFVNGELSLVATLPTNPNFSSVTADVGNFSTINASNLSTASISFDPSDFNFANGELSLVATLPTDPNFSSMIVDGNVGIGINTPERLFHVRGRNATWRLDRDVNSPAIQIHQFDTNFVGDPLKGFIIGVNGNGPNDGNFFINDYGRDVTGGSTPRFSIENNGAVIINHSLTTDVGNFSTINISTINGLNLSTASISFNTTDFNFANDELSLAVNASQIQTATIDDIKGGLTFNAFSTLNNLFVVRSSIIDATQSLTAKTSTITTMNSSTINSSVINGETANISTLNISTINGLNLSTASISFNTTDFNFANDELSLAVNASQIQTATINDIKGGLNFNPFSVLDGLSTITAQFVNANIEIDALQSRIGTMNSSTINSSIINTPNVNVSTLTATTGNFKTINVSTINGASGSGSLPANANFSSVNISNDINMGGSIITDNGVYTNYKIPVIGGLIGDGAVFLLCLKDGGDNECVGRMYYQRNSGHDSAGIVDIVVSSRQNSGDLPNGFCSYQTNQQFEGSATPNRYSIISGTFSGVDFIGLKYEGGVNFAFTDVYFDGILKTTGTNDPFQMITNSQFTNQVVLGLNNAELSLLNKSLVIKKNGDVNVSGSIISSTGNFSTVNISSFTANSGEIMNNLEVYNNLDVFNDLFVSNRIDATTVDALDFVGDNGDFGTTNTSTINSSNGNFSSTVVNGTGSFQTVVANSVNVTGTINASNINGYQEELTAGNNISILNNVISATGGTLPANANFSSVKSEYGEFINVGINTNSTRTRLSISPTTTEPKITLWDGGGTTDHYGFGVSSGQLNYHTMGDHVFYYDGKNGNGTERFRINGPNGYVTKPSQVRFRVRRTNSITFNTANGTLPFNQIVENVGGGYNSQFSTFTAPVTGNYYFYGQFFTSQNNIFRVDFFSGTSRIRRVSREGEAGVGGPTSFSASFHHPLNAGQTMRMVLFVGQVVVVGGEFSGFGGYLLG